MSLYKVDVSAAAELLVRPFYLEQVARVDHFALYLYLCEGAVARHRHSTQDELFYVHEGLLSLDTDWGRVGLTRRELAVVPRGLAHTSSSLMRTMIILFQAYSDAERRNGHGRLSADKRLSGLPKWSVDDEAHDLGRPYLPHPLTQVDEMSLRLVWCQGETPWHSHLEHDEMLLVIEGRLQVEVEGETMGLAQDELLVIPRHQVHRLISSQHTLALSLIHGEVDPLTHMGHSIRE
jgi:mannose-6-phosphate isomerase-like protein (cupin superfamily)